MAHPSFISQYEQQSGLNPGSLQPVAPRSAEIRPISQPTQPTVTTQLATTTEKPVLPPSSAVFVSKDAQALNIGNRVSQAVRENPALRKMLAEWVKSADKFPDISTAVAKLDSILKTAGY